jgi:CHAD domain-containing protein
VNLERETKLQVPPGFRLPDLAADGWTATVGEPERLVTIYFDTPDLHIARWGCSLRHRRGEGWTVKLPDRGDEDDGAFLARREVVFEGAEARRPPEAAVDLVRAYVRTAALGTVARLHTRRARVDVTDELGLPLAVVTDDEVSVMQGRRVASRFREVEVELVEGTPPEVLDSLVGRLRDDGGATVDNVSKLARALGPAAIEAPEVIVPEIDRDATVAEVVRRAIAASVTRLLRHDPDVRLGEDPEAVHQARVATRRLRSDLRTFRDVVEPSWAAPLRAELRWLGGELGAVRDAEVLRDRIAGRAEALEPRDRAGVDAFVTGLERRRAQARSHLLGELRTERYDALLDSLVEASAAPRVHEELAQTRASEALRPALEALWKHLATAVGQAGTEGSDEALHAARIRAKRMRYAAEAVVPASGKRAREFAEAVADLQDVLGEHQDSVIARAWLRESASLGDPFVAGELAAVEAAAASDARASWPRAWKALSRKRLRFWA